MTDGNGICLACYDPLACAQDGACGQELAEAYSPANEADFMVEDDREMGIFNGYGDYDEDDPWRHVDPPEW